MPPVVAVVFWIWVLGSVAFLIHRRISRRRDEEGTVDDALEAPTPVEAVGVEPVEAPVPVGAAVAATTVATPEVAQSAPTLPTPSPVFETMPPASIERQPRSAPAAGIADALVGIQMPCDLVPLVVDRLSNNHVTLSTTGHPAEVVGTALADEIERLGYALRPVSDTEVIATRGTTELRLAIQPPGTDGRHLDHPNARDDAVIVHIALT